MGLDAYVYRNRARLPIAPSTPGVSIDDRTGVVDFDDAALFLQFADQVVAVRHRLGNISQIAQLAEEVQRATSEQLPIITKTVLGTGAHAGDVIEGTELEALEIELNCLASSTAAQSPWLNRFVLQMRELVVAAHSEGNPIYFG